MSKRNSIIPKVSYLNNYSSYLNDEMNYFLHGQLPFYKFACSI